MDEEQKRDIMREMAAKGGSAKVKKGFASQPVRDKALATRRLRAAEKRLKKDSDLA